MSPHSLVNFEIQRRCQDETKFNGAFPKNNSTKIKNGEYLLDLDEYKSIGTHWIALCVNGNNVTYF